MLLALEDTKKILEKFQISDEFDINKSNLDNQLSKLNERINNSEKIIDFFRTSKDDDVRKIYDQFSRSMYKLVNSHHTLKINQGLGDSDDLRFMNHLIKEIDDNLDTMSFMWRG